MSVPVTIPGAPVTVYRLRSPIDGVPPIWIDEPREPGTHVNIAGARAVNVELDPPRVVIEVAHDVIWKFTVGSEAIARDYAKKFAIRAGR